MAKQIHFAEVTRNTDEENGSQLRGAVYFTSETFTGGVEYPEPAEPIFPYANSTGGFFWVPLPGDIIEIEIDTAIEHPRPRWRGMVYSSVDELSEEFRNNYPFRMGMRSNAGHVLLFDDLNGEELLRLQHSFGTKLEMDVGGNWVEFILRDKNKDIRGGQTTRIRKNVSSLIGGNFTQDIYKDSSTRVRGNHTHNVDGDYELNIGGKYILNYNEIVNNIGQKSENVTGGSNKVIDGGSSETIGGASVKSVLSNKITTVGGDENKMVAGESSETCGLGKKYTVTLGNAEYELVAGNYVVSIIAGSIDLTTVAGDVEMSTITGGATMGNLIGVINVSSTGSISISSGISNLDMDPLGNITLSNGIGNIGLDLAGNATVSGTTVLLGNATGNVLTNLSDPILDTLTGLPHIGVPTVLAG